MGETKVLIDKGVNVRERMGKKGGRKIDRGEIEEKGEKKREKGSDRENKGSIKILN